MCAHAGLRRVRVCAGAWVAHRQPLETQPVQFGTAAASNRYMGVHARARSVSSGGNGLDWYAVLHTMYCVVVLLLLLTCCILWHDWQWNMRRRNCKQQVA